MMISSNFSNALLLYAISYECQHKGIASLVGIISAEDSIDRSAPSLAELNTGLAGLLSAGLIEREADGFRVTRAGARMYEVANAGAGKVSSRLKKMAELIGELHPVGGSSQELTASEYQNAYDAYYDAS